MLVRSTDTKAGAAHGVDERVGLLTVALAADAPDVDVDSVASKVRMQVSYMLQQHCLRNHVALIANQKFEHLKFSRHQFDGPTAAGHRSRYA
jgi:hypothetical protein